MPDNLTPEQRSYGMSRVRGRGNASTELRMVALLREHGLRGWRRHAPIAERPDFVFPRERVAVFVDGCFWHGCPRCFRMPETNRDYWERKIGRNIARDKRYTLTLRRRGWRVIRVWEHSLSAPSRVASRIRRALAIMSEPGASLD